ncbi:CBO0543 family protein [Paenibacillus tarimensis]|uniref:CBO0543 family protein n=1 Tax=Paenibacillus tarimensis TaxID=416012 RepID=UPI001F36CDA9|nr:CBO0543 family protein [Paenibacillus tarimensis]MCF2941971.1 hypothetical protein [Paenibacillus tarimensis]
MKKIKTNQQALAALCVLFLGLLVYAFRRPPRKDWMLAYLFNAASNMAIDNVVVNKGYIEYPVRLFPKIFETHLLFNLFYYPTATILYNQMTYRDKPLHQLYKVFIFSVPLVFIEAWANANTKLVKWKKGWRWYHTFLGITIKSLITRWIVQLARYITSKEE